MAKIDETKLKTKKSYHNKLTSSISINLKWPTEIIQNIVI